MCTPRAPAANRAKMAAGVPRTDTERRPWVEALREGLIVDAARPPAAVVREIRERLRLGQEPDGTPGLPHPAVS